MLKKKSVLQIHASLGICKNIVDIEEGLLPPYHPQHLHHVALMHMVTWPPYLSFVYLFVGQILPM